MVATVLAALCSLALLVGAGAPDEADLALSRIEAEFPSVPRDRAEAALERLAARWPERPAAARALLWLGSLAIEDRRLDRAAALYGRVERRFDGEPAAVARRGLGDVALARGDWGAAIARYEAAQAGASPTLAAELTQKIGLARRERTRARIEWASWLVLAAGLVRVLWRRQGRPRGVPTETILVAPIYALLIAVAWPRDAHVAHALCGIALGSMTLLTLLFAPPAPTVRGPRLRLAADLLLVAAAHLALFYIALRRAGLLDSLWMTVGER